MTPNKRTRRTLIGGLLAGFFGWPLLPKEAAAVAPAEAISAPSPSSGSLVCLEPETFRSVTLHHDSHGNLVGRTTEIRNGKHTRMSFERFPA